METGFEVPAFSKKDE
ncbi:MAG: hypothetical protein ACMVP2_00250 [Imperialibacter sp.]